MSKDRDRKVVQQFLEGFYSDVTSYSNTKKEVKEAIDNGHAGSESIDVPEWKKILALPRP